MNYIIYDLEATCWDGRPPGLIQETIEIGAVMLDEYGTFLGSYNRFIKPVINPFLSPFCQRLTSITQEEINRASNFPRVIDEFQDWGEVFEGEYFLCSWGSFDRKMLVNDCMLHKLDYEWVEDRHINLKRQYHEFKRFHRPVGLKSAVKKEGFEFTGIHHRGISDAENLAKIFRKHLDIWRF